MKRFLSISIVFAILISATFCGCQKEKSDKLEFVTSCYPVYIMALNLTDGLENVNIVNMVENHQGCLHNFQLRSEDLKRIEKSSAFIINGAGMESFLDKVIKELPKVNVIDSSENIELMQEHHEHSHDCESEHCHHEFNPHIWLSVSNYIKQVQNVANGLIDADPKNKEIYQKNAEIYINKLEQLKSEMESTIANLKSRNIITFHEAFPYFAKEFNLNIAAVISEEPENGPSSKELAETIETAKKLGIKALFVEPQYPNGAAEVIAQEINADIYTLDSAVTGDASKDSYINVMRKNTKTLSEALN